MVMNEKKTQLSDLMASSMDKIREMVDSNTIIGQPIVTADGVTRVMPVALPAMSTADRVIEMVPQVMDRVENYIDRKKANGEA